MPRRYASSLLLGAALSLCIAGTGWTKSPPAEFAKSIAAYRVYLLGETEALVTATQALVAAVKAGHLEEARSLYAPARIHYERIEPIAEQIGDLDDVIDARADAFPKKEADAGWVGFHRLEKALFADNTTKGMDTVATKLLADTKALHRGVPDLKLSGKAMVDGAGGLIEELAGKKTGGEEDRYSRSDLWDFQANIDGAHKIYTLLQPQVTSRDSALATRIDAEFTAANALLAKHKSGDGFELYDKLTEADRTEMQHAFTALAESLAKLPDTLGVG